MWALVAGPIMGGAAGFFLTRSLGINPIIGVLPGIPAGVFAVYRFALMVADSAAGAFQHINNPSGDTTPYKRDHSYAQSLAVRGRYEEAIAAYQRDVLEDPRDPAPYLEIARLYRDQLDRPADAVTWFRRARSDAIASPGHEMMATQEIVELFVHKLREPRKAIPELARLVERFPGAPAAEAARRELAELREQVAQEWMDAP
jgi:tetratricopeptide (TPR) repeat protein